MRTPSEQTSVLSSAPSLLGVLLISMAASNLVGSYFVPLRKPIWVDPDVLVASFGDDYHFALLCE